MQRYDFNSGVSSCARPSMVPSPSGEWVKYDEVATLLGNLPKQATQKLVQTKCYRKIEIPNTNGIQVTYCMLPTGHEGNCK